MRLQEYPTDTRIQIGERIFRKESYGTFWREEHAQPGNCVSRPHVSLENIQRDCEGAHVVLTGLKH